MKRRPTYPVPASLRPTLRHLWRHKMAEGDLMFQARSLADQGDRVNLLRADRQRFTIVRNGDCYLVRDARDEPIGTFDTVRECIAAGDAHLDATEDAREQHEADFGPHDPKGAA